MGRAFGLVELIGLAALVAASVSLPGCRGPQRIDPDLRLYPEALVQGQTLNVQVFRDGTDLSLTNTTSGTLGPGVLWVNKWWSRPVPAVPPGESLRVPLGEFLDRYGDPFRAGGFFATRNPDLVVLTQLEAEGRLLGLVVVENRIE